MWTRDPLMLTAAILDFKMVVIKILARKQS